MPKIDQWSNFPEGVRQHLLERMRDRAISVAHLNQLRLWIETRPEVPEDMLAIMIYTASRAGAVASLKRGSFYRAGDQSMLHFEEKGGKSREIPVRHDLEGIIADFLDAAGLRNAPKDAAFFPIAIRKTGQLTPRAIHVNDVCRMMKRR